MFLSWFRKTQRLTKNTVELLAYRNQNKAYHKPLSKFTMKF